MDLRNSYRRFSTRAQEYCLPHSKDCQKHIYLTLVSGQSNFLNKGCHRLCTQIALEQHNWDVALQAP